MDDLISIIVPVYNVEKYLRRCLENLIRQSYHNLEIIVVDDGSTDSSSKICDYYASLDLRIKVIHKENGGLSDARNAALDIIKGKYVTCIDSDDYVDEKYIEYLYDLIKINDADISICSYKIIDDNNNEIVKHSHDAQVRIMDQKEALFELLSIEKFSNSAWGKLYKADLFEGIRYPIGRIFEDLATTYKLFMKSKTIIFGDEAHYYYLLRTGSISRQTNFNIKRMDAVFFCEEMVECITEKYSDLYDIGLCRLFDIYISIFRLINKKDFNELYNEIWNKIKQIRIKVLKYKHSGKKRKIYVLISFFGTFIFRRFVNFVKSK